MSKTQATEITREDIQTMASTAASRGHDLPKWVLYGSAMLRAGLTVKVYKAETTVSKYIYVSDGKTTIKVRFSNHNPNPSRARDVDIVIGGKITTEDAKRITLQRFGLWENNKV